MDILRLEQLTAEPTDDWPRDWEAQARAWPQPDRSTLFEVHFTSGTTAAPKGVLLTHGNFLESMGMFSNLLDGRHLRAVSILPLSHLLEQISTLFFGTMMGAEVVYVRSRNPRVIFEAMRELPATAMVMTPQVLELFWSGIMREVRAQGREGLVERARRVARHLPYRLRRVIFRSLHAQLGGSLELVVSAGAYLPPELQEAWEDIGIVVLQGLRLHRVRLRHGQRRVASPQGPRRPGPRGHRCAHRPRLGRDPGQGSDRLGRLLA